MNSTTHEARMRSALVDALYELENRIVPALTSSIALEHDLIGLGSEPSCRHEIHTRRMAKTLGSLAAIMAKIEEAAR